MSTNTKAAMGHQATLSINGTSYPFSSESLQKRATHPERVGIRGTRSHDVDDVRAGSYTVEGSITIQPTLAGLSALAILAIGPGGVVNEKLQEFTVIVDRETQVFTYAGCKIGQFDLSGSQGELLELTLTMIGKTEARSGSAPAEPASAVPFIFSDGTLTLQSASRPTDSFRLIIDNALVGGQFRMNTTVDDIPEGDRNVTLTSRHPFNTTANTTLYDQAIAGATGTLVLNDGSSAVTFTFGKLQVPAESPMVTGKDEIFLDLNMTARKDGATKEIAFA